MCVYKRASTAWTAGRTETIKQHRKGKNCSHFPTEGAIINIFFVVIKIFGKNSYQKFYRIAGTMNLSLISLSPYSNQLVVGISFSSCFSQPKLATITFSLSCHGNQTFASVRCHCRIFVRPTSSFPSSEAC